MPTLKIKSEIIRTYQDVFRPNEKNSYFIDQVSSFITSNLHQDSVKLIIATRQNQDAIQSCLKEKSGGFPDDLSYKQKKCIFIEAETLLEQIDTEGWPNEKKFHEALIRILDQARHSMNVPVYVFGETVALLSAKGKLEAAIFLETVWEKLAATYSFSFPCGSGLISFAKSDGHIFPVSQEATREHLESQDNLQQAIKQKLIEYQQELDKKTAELIDSNKKLRAEISRCNAFEKELAHLQKVQCVTQKLSHLGSWEADPYTMTLTCSDEFYRICGLEPQSRIIDFAFTQSIIHPDDQAASSNAIQATIHNNEPYIIEKRIIRPDGSIRHVISQGEVIFNASGEVDTVIGAYLDISELKQAEENFRRSHEELRKLAAHQDKIKEKEQRRIAQELHDELGGLLTGLKAYIATAIENIRPDTRKATDMLIEAANIADTALESTRRIVNDLHPNVLDHLGLWAALKWYGERITQGKNLICVFLIDDSADNALLDLERSTMLFRICQEALTNVMRHSKASHINISASCHKDVLAIKIEDNGIGFNADRLDNRESMGISGMHERARSLGGALRITSQTGKGTTIQLSLPLEEVPNAVE